MEGRSGQRRHRWEAYRDSGFCTEQTEAAGSCLWGAWAPSPSSHQRSPAEWHLSFEADCLVLILAPPPPGCVTVGNL